MERKISNIIFCKTLLWLDFVYTIWFLEKLLGSLWTTKIIVLERMYEFWNLVC